MNKRNSDLVVVGAILGAHGVRGDVRIKSFTAQPDAIFEYGPFLSEDGALMIDPVKTRPGKDHFIVSPSVTRQKEEWDGLKSTKLYVPRDVLPEPDDDEFYIEDLVGLDVYAGGETPLGRVKAVLNHGAGDLVEVQGTGGTKSVLVPFTMVDVPVVDLALGRIVVANFDTWADESRPDDA